MCVFTLALRKLNWMMILQAVFPPKNIPMFFFSFVVLISFYLLGTVDMVALDRVSSSAKKTAAKYKILLCLLGTWQSKWHYLVSV